MIESSFIIFIFTAALEYYNLLTVKNIFIDPIPALINVSILQ